MMGEPSRILDEIDALLAAPKAEEAGLARLEDVLTAGYAHALALEAERARLERRLEELAGLLADDDSGRPSDELAEVARRISSAHDDLTHLRAMLVELRDRARAARVALSRDDPIP